MLIRDPNGSLQGLIASAVDLLREPAGKKYRSLDDIKQNRSQFLSDFYSGLYLLHALTIRSILDAEEKMSGQKGLPSREFRSSKAGWTRVRQLFRCINDSIAWIALGKQASLFIRRTCRKKPRGNLKDQNHRSVMKVMQDMFAAGAALPVWNDTTRCLDINDITLFSPKGISFFELKQGTVNERISDMMRKTDQVEILKDLDKFFTEFGPKGMKQIDRVIRQADVGKKLLRLSKDDVVFDPFLGVERRAIDPPEQLEHYEDEITPLLERLRSVDFVEHSVDGCLHILGLNRERAISVERGRDLIERHLKSKAHRPGEGQSYCRDVILSLDSSFEYHTAMPIMLRGWAKEDISRVCVGHFELYFLFDVNAWARHFKRSRLVWSSRAEGRREMSKPAEERLLLVQERLAKVIGERGQDVTLGTHFLQEILCEGIRPRSMASFYDHYLNLE